MEENTTTRRFQSDPDALPYTEENALRGSLQDVLIENIGLFVNMDFLIGANTIVTKQGILYSVGVSFVVLYDAPSGTYVVCDLYAIKFATFFDPASMGSLGKEQ